MTSVFYGLNMCTGQTMLESEHPKAVTMFWLAIKGD